MLAIGHSTVVFTSVRSGAILKILSQDTVLARRTLLLIALVGRQQSPKSPRHLEALVGTQSQAATSHATSLWPADILVPKYVILEIADPAACKSRLLVAVPGRRLSHSVTKVISSRHSVDVYAVRISTAEDMHVMSDAALARRKQSNVRLSRRKAVLWHLLLVPLMTASKRSTFVLDNVAGC
jgi:hypothetical protein